jgi:hypothetical protein
LQNFSTQKCDFPRGAKHRKKENILKAQLKSFCTKLKWKIHQTQLN